MLTVHKFKAAFLWTIDSLQFIFSAYLVAYTLESDTLYSNPGFATYLLYNFEKNTLNKFSSLVNFSKFSKFWIHLFLNRDSKTS